MSCSTWSRSVIRPPELCVSAISTPTAVLVLLSAPAGARVIPPVLLAGLDWLACAAVAVRRHHLLAGTHRLPIDCHVVDRVGNVVLDGALELVEHARRLDL